jgi:hypothetical protein
MTETTTIATGTVAGYAVIQSWDGEDAVRSTFLVGAEHPYAVSEDERMTEEDARNEAGIQAATFNARYFEASDVVSFRVMALVDTV